MSSRTASHHRPVGHEVIRHRTAGVVFDLRQFSKEDRATILQSLRDALNEIGLKVSTRLRGIKLSIMLNQPRKQPNCNHKINRTIDRLVALMHGVVAGVSSRIYAEVAYPAIP